MWFRGSSAGGSRRVSILRYLEIAGDQPDDRSAAFSQIVTVDPIAAAEDHAAIDDGLPITRRRTSLYIGTVWIRIPKELHMKHLLDLLLVMGIVGGWG